LAYDYNDVFSQILICYVSSTASAGLAKCPVPGLVQQVRSHFEWQSVIVVGRYEEYPDTPKYKELRIQAQALLEKRYLWWQTAYAANQARSHARLAAPVFYCVHIEEITGHRASPDQLKPRPASHALMRDRLGYAVDGTVGLLHQESS
jgi:hypothetical protein